MSIFFNVFFKFSGALFSIFFFILVLAGISSYLNSTSSKDFFQFVEGSKNSTNTIVVFNISGPIINDKMHFTNIANIQIISPKQIKNKLEIIEKINPAVLN